jgi:hypothetical protein
MINVIINISPALPLREVAVIEENLLRSGFVIGRINVLFGVLTGQAPANKITEIQATPGVVSVVTEASLWDRASFPQS